MLLPVLLFPSFALHFAVQAELQVVSMQAVMVAQVAQAVVAAVASPMIAQEVQVAEQVHCPMSVLVVVAVLVADLPMLVAVGRLAVAVADD